MDMDAFDWALVGHQPGISPNLSDQRSKGLNRTTGVQLRVDFDRRYEVRISRFSDHL